MSRLSALVVDDEEPARQRLEDLLSQEPRWRVVASVDGGEEALAAIRETRPDLVFLDVQMPEVDGFQVVERLDADELPLIVFVTAYDEYALAAFQACALDYLLKPFGDRRFRETLQRAEEQIRLRRLGEVRDRMLALLERVEDADAGDARAAGRPVEIEGSGGRGKSPLADRIAVPHRDRTLLLRPTSIDYISADGPYMCFHVGDRELLLRERMHVLEERLEPHGFLRVHRSTLVNLDRVVALEPYFRGEAHIRLGDGTRLKVSRSRQAALRTALGIEDEA